MERLELVQYALIKYYLRKDDESEIYIGCAETKEYSEILKLFTIMKNNDIDIQLPTEEDLLVINIYLK